MSASAWLSVHVWLADASIFVVGAVQNDVFGISEPYFLLLAPCGHTLKFWLVVADACAQYRLMYSLP